MRRLLTLPLATSVVSLMAAAFLAVGCEYITYDLGSIEFQPATDIEPGDAGDAGDVGDVGDVGPGDAGDAGDAGDVGPDADAADVGPDADVSPGPESCMYEFALDPEICNPARGTGCGAGNACNIGIVDGTPKIGCVEAPTDPGSAIGESCGSYRDCPIGSTCANWSPEVDPRGLVCSKFCELETGEGCEADEFCTRAVSMIQVRMPGLGLCTPRCDPYDPQACGPNRTCSIDYRYPLNTCLPEFRCVLSASPGRAEGASCTPSESTQMCQRGLVCLEETCVKPCGSDDECAGGQSCGTPATAFRLRYCQ